MADLLETIEDGVAILTLNRPDRLNAFSPECWPSCAKLCRDWPPTSRSGRSSSPAVAAASTAGGDVKTMAAREQGQTFEQRLEGYRSMHQIPLMMRTLPKVIIGMVNGPAVGAGLGLALACDLRIAGRSARFATGFANVGYSGDFGGSWLLTRLVGTAKARELYFLNEMLDGEQAAALGIVNRVVDDAALRDETLALARRIAEGPRVALGYMKRNLHAAETEPFAWCWRWRASTRPASARPRTTARQWRRSREAQAAVSGAVKASQRGRKKRIDTPSPCARGCRFAFLSLRRSPAPTYAPRTPGHARQTLTRAAPCVRSASCSPNSGNASSRPVSATTSASGAIQPIARNRSTARGTRVVTVRRIEKHQPAWLALPARPGRPPPAPQPAILRAARRDIAAAAPPVPRDPAR